MSSASKHRQNLSSYFLFLLSLSVSVSLSVSLCVSLSLSVCLSLSFLSFFLSETGTKEVYLVDVILLREQI